MMTVAVQTVLFHRDFQGFTGGHLKVFNYFEHAEATPGFRSRIYFSPDTLWDQTNPWLVRRGEALTDWRPQEADILFLAGFDWRMVPDGDESRPIINLLQHVHHADPANPLSTFLRRRAVRICVSEEVRAAVEGHGANGPVIAIPNGIDLAALPDALPREARLLDWLVAGHKEDRPARVRAIAASIQTWGRVEALTKSLPRAEFLEKIASAKNVVLLPRDTEGFYLPALEAMALKTLVICPDCVGNRSFCRNGDTSYTGGTDGILSAMENARSAPLPAQLAMIERAAAVAALHTLSRERAAFQQVLAALKSLW